VVVPARDEALTLPRLLADLGGQDGIDLEIVVVDDCSADGTADVARRFGVTVVDGRPPPAGWAGKPWACHQGAGASTAATLIFLDADVELAPTAIAAAVDARHRRGGLLSVVPRHRVERPYEYLSILPNIVSVMASGAAMVQPSSSPAAFGPCLVTRRAEYLAVGGHAAVAASVLDDVDLGRAYRGQGLPVTVLGGADLVGYRMYPAGPAAVVEGWTKNLAGGAGRIPAWRAAATALWVTATLSGTVALGWEPPIAAIAYLGVAAQVEVLAHRVGAFRRGVGLLHPLLSVSFLYLFVRAVGAVALGRVHWKGRTIPVRT